VGRVIGYIFAIGFWFFWFVPVLFSIIVILPFGVLMDISVTMTSGFASPTSDVYPIFVFMLGLVLYVSLRFRYFRRIYDFFPFLYPMVKMVFFMTIIATIAMLVLNWGYSEINDVKHIVSVILMMVIFIIGRVLMSLYFYKKPVVPFDKLDE
jgi:hypothetical protein